MTISHELIDEVVVVVYSMVYTCTKFFLVAMEHKLRKKNYLGGISTKLDLLGSTLRSWIFKHIFQTTLPQIRL